MWKVVLATLAAALAAGAGAAAVLVATGAYDVAATAQHTQPVYSLMETAMRRSVRLRARGIDVPPDLADPARQRQGAACFRDHCVQCHGAPGVAPAGMALGMQPQPGPLVDAARRWRPREIYWIVRHGVKMSGMPAWEYRLADADLWAVTAFVADLPQLTRERYGAAMAQAAGIACNGAAANPARGRTALHQYACNSCHSIPGVTGSSPQVGPPLAGIGSRQLIAGRLPNTPENLAAWIAEPQRFDPHTTMPDLDVTPAHARDMAAYLATLR